MAEPEPPASLRQIMAVAECTSHIRQHVEGIKSPYALHQERATTLRKTAHRLMERVRFQPDTQRGTGSEEEDILRIGGELSELERKHAATIENEVKAYHATMDEQLKKLCKDFINIVGVSMVMETLGKQPTDFNKGLVNSTDDTTDITADATEDLTTIQETRPTSPDTVVTQPVAESEEAEPQDSDSAQDQPAPTNFPITRKRAAPMTPSFGGVRKRTRAEKAASDKLARTIEFDDAFQDGKATIKHIMVNYEDEWYIIRCHEHGLSFKDNPLIAGGKHLNGRAHGKLPKTREMVIERLGIRVLNCNAKLAEKNNKASREAFRKGYEPPRLDLSTQSNTADSIEALETSEPPNQDSEVSQGRPAASTSQRYRKKFEGIIDPIPGDIYRAYWPKDKAWHAVLVLPGVATDRSVDIGLSGTIQDLGLTEQLPPCYVYNSETGVLDWKDEYKDGGSSVTKRQFPVMYFDGLDFPSKSAVGWVSADDLELGNVRDKSFKLIPNYQSALRFLNAREERRQQNMLKAAEKKEPEQEPPKDDAPEPAMDTSEDLPPEQDKDEEPPKNPETDEKPTQEDHEMSEPPQEAPAKPIEDSTPKEDPVRRDDAVEIETQQDMQEVDIVTISSSSPRSDSLELDSEAPAAMEDPESNTEVSVANETESIITSSAPTSAKHHPPSVEDDPDRRSLSERNEGLMKTAAACLSSNEWHKAQNPDTDLPPGVVSVKNTDRPVHYFGNTPIPDELVTIMQNRRAEKRSLELNIQPGSNAPPLASSQSIASPQLVASPQSATSAQNFVHSRPMANPRPVPHVQPGFNGQPAANTGPFIHTRPVTNAQPMYNTQPTLYSSSPPYQQRPHSSSSLPNILPNNASGRPILPASPPRRASVMLPVPRDLNKIAPPTLETYRISPFKPANANNQPGFPQPQLANNPPLPVPQSRAMNSSQPPVTLPPMTIPSMSSGASPSPHSFSQSPLTAPPHPLPSQRAASAAAYSNPPPFNPQIKYSYLQHETGSDVRRVYVCHICGKRYLQDHWRDKHIVKRHPEHANQ